MTHKILRRRRSWRCRLNPQHPNYANNLPHVPSEEEVFAEQLSRVTKKIRLRRAIDKSILVFLAIFIGGTLILSLPSTIQLNIEGIYPYEPAVATYHLEFVEPSLKNSTMALNLKLSSNRPAIMSHVPLTMNIVLSSNLNRTDILPDRYYAVFSGSQCERQGEHFALADGTCKYLLLKNNDGKYRNTAENIKYLTSGEFPVILTTGFSGNGSISRTESQHIVILPIETYLGNEYARNALNVAIFAAVVVVAFELYKLSRSRTSP